MNADGSPDSGFDGDGQVLVPPFASGWAQAFSLALQADVAGAALFGIQNICCLTGDDVTAGDEPETRRVFDLDSTQLVSVVRGLAEAATVPVCVHLDHCYEEEQIGRAHV